MKANIKTTDGTSTLELEIDFSQLLNDNFEEICKAIAIRGKALKELVSLLENNNEIIESVLQILKISMGEKEAVNNLCNKLKVSNYTAQFLMNMSLEEMTSLDWEKLKGMYDNYVRNVKKL